METIMVPGAAGFIGGRVSEYLVNKGYQVIGLDNLNNYYDTWLKEKRLDNLKKLNNFKFYEMDIENYVLLESVFKEYQFHGIINEAARAGIRASIENPLAYQKTNVEGNLNLLELCKKYHVQHYVLASTSSVYSGCKEPFQEEFMTDSPYSPYAATKKSAELMAYAYHYLYHMNVAVLRYFTVYGPFGRPDMVVFRFIKWIMEGKKVQIYGDGQQKRDFTYIDDIVEGILKIAPLPPRSKIPNMVYNMGCASPVQLMDFIRIIEEVTGKRAVKEMTDMQPGDVVSTYADTSLLEQEFGYRPHTSVESGIRNFHEWFKKNNRK